MRVEGLNKVRFLITGNYNGPYLAMISFGSCEPVFISEMLGGESPPINSFPKSTETYGNTQFPCFTPNIVITA